MEWEVRLLNIGRRNVVTPANIMSGIGISVQSITAKYMHSLCVIVGATRIQRMGEKMLSKEEKLEILYEMYDDLCSLSEDVKADALSSAIRAYATKLEVKDLFQLTWKMRDLTDKEKEAIKKCINGKIIAVPFEFTKLDCVECTHHDKWEKINS